jgi:hypothetical protein
MTSLDIFLVLVGLIALINITVGGVLIAGGLYHTFRTPSPEESADPPGRGLASIFFISGIGLLLVGALTFEVARLDYADAVRTQELRSE